MDFENSEAEPLEGVLLAKLTGGDLDGTDIFMSPDYSIIPPTHLCYPVMHKDYDLVLASYTCSSEGSSDDEWKWPKEGVASAKYTFEGYREIFDLKK